MGYHQTSLDFRTVDKMKGDIKILGILKSRNRYRNKNKNIEHFWSNLPSEQILDLTRDFMATGIVITFCVLLDFCH